MKKLVAIVIVALVVLVGVGPLISGRVAHSRLDKGLDALVQKVPYIKVVERKWTSGWFRSESMITFEFAMPGAGRKPVAAFADAAPPVVEEEDSEDSTEEGTVDEEEADEPVEDPSAQAIPKFPTIPPVRFQVSSSVLHGPVLGTAGMGLARLDSKFVISEEIRKKLIEVLGTDEPVHIRTRMAFLGGGTTTLSGEGRSVPLSKLSATGPKGSIAWDAFKLSIGMSRKDKGYDVSGRQPRIEFKSEDGAEHVLFSNLTLDGKGKRVTEDLYDGKAGFGIGKMTVASSRSPAVDVSNIRYDVDSNSKGEYFDYAVRMGSGEIKAAQLESIKLQLKEVHYDLTVRHLHTPTLQKLTRSLRDAYSDVLGNPAGAEAAMMGPLLEHGKELLKHDPEFVIDRIGVVTAQGEAAFRGTIKLPGVTEEDLKSGAMALVPKMVADIVFEAPQALFESVPNGNMMMGAGIDQGYLKREGTKVTSHIEFRNGKLSVNGKTPAIPPMFGGQPPAAPTVESPPTEPPVAN